MEHLEKKPELHPTLEPASETDIDVLLELEKGAAVSETYSATLEKEEWEEELKNNVVSLITVEGKTVGSIMYEQKAPDHIHISGLVVRSEFQGRGIARKALTQILEEHPEARRVDLVTHPDNPALKLYESLGFVVEARKEDYFGDGQPRLVLALTRTQI